MAADSTRPTTRWEASGTRRGMTITPAMIITTSVKKAGSPLSFGSGNEIGVLLALFSRRLD